MSRHANRPLDAKITRRAAVAGALSLTALPVLSGQTADAATAQVIARITPRHAYDMTTIAAMRFAPLAGAEFTASGLMMHPEPDGTLSVVQLSGQPRPSHLKLIFSLDDDLKAITTVNGAPVTGQLRATAGPGARNAALTTIDRAAADAFGLGFLDFGLLKITLPATGTLDVALTFDVVRTHWVYVIPNAPDVTLVSQTNGPIIFTETSRRLANGSIARVFRSDKPVALSARETPGFIVTFVDHTGVAHSLSLPNATGQITGTDPQAPNALMTEIFVNL